MTIKSALLLSLALAAPALATETPPPAATVYQLTPEQKEAAMHSAAPQPADPLLEADRPARQIHGEVGVMIGTGGARGVFGTAAIPLGQDGIAVISMESMRLPDFRYRRNH